MIENNEYYTFNEYIKNNELSPNEEDYIEMIYRLKTENKSIKISELAQALNIKNPSVSKMVKKLQTKDIVIHSNYGTIDLTIKGETIGKTLFARHNTIEQFLKIIGVENNLHEETEKIEHTINSDTLNKIINLVDFFKENPIVLEHYQKYRSII
ncbi:metal-dependent transcriptional regulator [Romboutsia sp.]|uniref:metal-dependent transcriptional regulator n=1 Tax=Romboutsia sp. TaxID=1965302 RepID=UPI003F3BE245